MPVVNVTWYEASLFCRWAFPEGGRLPSEVEWEVASRGGGISTITRNFHGVTTPIATWLTSDARGGASGVKGYPPNSIGIYDPVGNVFQWCSDWYDRAFYKTVQVANPKGPAEGRWGHANQKLCDVRTE
jgi:sulfatase modifying factor 1